MQPRYIRIRELASTPARDGKPAQQGRYPVAAATLWRWAALGRFPAPVSLGPQTTAWRVDDLDAWDAARSEPAAGK